ncbi:hypothetical protein LguiA_028555 [Lonicera macranthoides]
MKLDTVDAVFNLATNQHDVQQVQQDSFDACTLTNPIGNSITNSPANITLNFVGDYYYTCTLGRHCQAGQKLAINVSSTPATSPPPSTTTTAPPSAPSPASNTSPDSACPLPNFLDAPADGPSVLTIFNRAGNSPHNSSSPAVFAIPINSSPFSPATPSLPPPPPPSSLQFSTITTCPKTRNSKV